MLISVLFLLSSCELVKDGTAVHGPARCETVSGRIIPSSSFWFGDDTTVLISAIRVPDSYDWVRDSLYGAIDCELLLFENLELKSVIPAGPSEGVSPDPDMHHFIGGHLYTEYSGVDETLLKCDGKEILRFSGREFLKGLIVKDGVTYTLYRSRDSETFTLRRDGLAIFRKEHGNVMGSFSDWSYGETGALYEDSGHIYFAFSGKSGKQFYCGVVEDGQEIEKKMPSENCRLVDCRMRNGIFHFIYEVNDAWLFNDGSRYWNLTMGRKGLWTEPRIVFNGSGAAEVAGEYCLNGGEPAFYRFFEDKFEMVTDADALPFMSKSGMFFIHFPSGAPLTVEYGGAVIASTAEPAFVYPGLAALSGGRLFLALSPGDHSLSPYLWLDGLSLSVPVHGYITGLEILTSKTDSKCL